ncbi:MAG: GH25 family lysozyme [Oscillospiraceae bacterium]|nr:GH25 family lysozyme [Oscillospiraceae bacterium]
MRNDFSIWVNITKRFSALSLYKKIAAVALALVIPLSAVVFAAAVATGDSPSGSSSSSSSQPESQAVVAPVSPSSSEAESESEVQPKKLTLNATSVEEDMEIQVLDENGELATGYIFEITIKSDSGYEKTYQITEMDGFLSLTKIKAGDYTVSMAEAEGYITAEPTTCNVKEKVAYEKIENVEVSDESTVDVPKEDASFGDVADKVEPLKDTVEFVESGSFTEDVTTDKVVVTYTPKLHANGNLLNAAGEDSGYSPVKDSTGKIVSGTRTILQTVALRGNTPVLQTMAYHYPASSFVVTLLSDETPSSTDSSSEASSISQSTETSSVETSSTESSSETSSSQESSSESSSSDSSTSSGSSDSSSGSNGNPVTETINLFKDDGSPRTDLFAFDKKETTTPVTTTVTKYTGWQTFNGKTYYYDKFGNKVTGWQVINGVNYYFDADGVRGNAIGVDVSKYQGNIDWNAVKNSGVSFAFIRVGYRGYSTGKIVEDPYFRKNIQGATAAGLKVGVYFFSQAITTAEAVEEASMVLEAVRGYNLAYPIAFDTEWVGDGARADNLSKSHRTSVAVAFCETIRNSGYRASVYASKSWFYNQLEYNRVSNYIIWLAHYTNQTDFAHRYDIWQYTSSGVVNGIPGRVDMNYSYIG